MPEEPLVPGVQHGGAADEDAAAAGIGGDGPQRLGRGPEQDVEHGLPVAAISPDMVKTTWKVRTGRMSRALAFIHRRAAAPWHAGQCRFRQEVYRGCSRPHTSH